MSSGFGAGERKRLYDALQKSQPRFAWLFGSQARGTANTDSDVDLLVVDERVGGEQGIEIDISLALMPREYHLDILALTPDRLREQLAQEQSFIATIFADAELVYERA